MSVAISLFKEILEKARDAVWVINEDNTIEYVNPASEELTGYTRDELVGADFSIIIPKNYAVDHASKVKSFASQGQIHSEILSALREFHILTKWQTVVPIELKAFEIETAEPGKRMFAGIMRDIRNRKQLEENQRMAMASLKKLAFIDELTMIPNRRSFYDVFRKMLASVQRHPKNAIVAVVDIDHFKDINDTYGHDVGDMVLRNVGNIFVENLREEDTVGRIGGEEFGVLLPETDAEGAMIVLERLRLAVKQFRFFVFENFYLNVTISIGFGKIHPHQSLEEIIKCADIALYKAKNSGRDSIENYEDCLESPFSS